MTAPAIHALLSFFSSPSGLESRVGFADVLVGVETAGVDGGVEGESKDEQLATTSE